MLILRQELIHPVRMLFKLRIGTDIASGKDRLRQIGKLLFQSGREHRQTHDLDQTDIFFLDVMQLRVRMVNTKRIFIRRDVIAEHQIQLVEIAVLSGNRRDRIVRFSVRLSINKSILIRIAAPCTQHLFTQINQAIRILGTGPQN